MADDAREHVDAASSDPRRQQRGGVVSRVWRGIFRGRGEDYGKRLEYLSKEEAAVHARMKRRAHRWRRATRDIVVLSVVLEVMAVTYAIITTRSPDLNWRMRAVHVLPMFLLPALASAIYSMLVSLLKMFDHNDQKTLERLRAERQAKIDELKERTNYYTTQQLIQRYDLDPSAKAAAATFLASKLGADTGLKFYLGDDSKLNTPLGKSSDVELVQSDGIRNRKQPLRRRHHSAGSDTMHQFTGDTSPEASSDGQEVTPQAPRVEQHYGSGTNDGGGWIARIAAMLVGEDPTQCYALICGNCHMHNGLARKEDFPYLTYYCPHCHALNTPRQLEDHSSGFSSGKISPPGPSSANTIVRNDSSASSVTEGEVTSNLATVQEDPTGDGEGKESGVQAN